MKSDRSDPKVAVVIIGRNEGERLIRCIQSVREMDYAHDRVDIIYVDSQSTDGSVDNARALGATVVEVAPERPCAAVGRNAGWREADAEYVLFLDGDTILHPRFVRTALDAFAADTAVVFGHRRELSPDASVYNLVIDLDWIWPLGELDFCGGDALMRRDVLAKVDGYDETLIAGEEPEMCARMREHGYTVLHIDAPMTGHDIDMQSFSQYWRRAVRTGHAYAEVSDMFRDTDRPFWEVESRRNFRHAGFLAGTWALAGLASVATRRPAPLAACAAFWGLVLGRSASRTQWKSPSLRSRLLYAVHSHFQQIPIAVGQIASRRLRARGEQQDLIEYK